MTEASKLTPELLDSLCEAIADGTPLRKFCRENDVGKSIVYEAIKGDEMLAGRIAQARVQGFDALAEEVLEIVDDVTEEAASRRVRAETRLKLLAKWDPKRYGEKVELAHSGGLRLTAEGLHDDELANIAAGGRPGAASEA